MIKANELRIGNLIIALGEDYDRGGNRFHDPDGDDIIIVDIDTFKAIARGSTDYSPIPLTPEWLERCGFEKRDAAEITFDLQSGVEYYYRNNKFIWHYRLSNRSTGEGYEHIEYVHQLQNIHLAHAGEELNVKL